MKFISHDGVSVQLQDVFHSQLFSTPDCCFVFKTEIHNMKYIYIYIYIYKIWYIYIYIYIYIYNRKYSHMQCYSLIVFYFVEGIYKDMTRRPVCGVAILLKIMLF